MAFVAFYDACVLYPAPLRDLLIRLARTNSFRARWSDEVNDEWIRNVIKERPELEEKLKRTRELMNSAVDDCLVTGYQGLVQGLELPDPNDKHVLAAAISGRADVIVTKNLKDFPEDKLSPYGIEAQHPDVFIRHVLDLDEAVALAAVRSGRLALKDPPRTVEEHLDTLSRQELPETVTFLRRWADLI